MSKLNIKCLCEGREERKRQKREARGRLRVPTRLDVMDEMLTARSELIPLLAEELMLAEKADDYRRQIAVVKDPLGYLKSDLQALATSGDLQGLRAVILLILEKENE